jgi:hypothetical protein
MFRRIWALLIFLAVLPSAEATETALVQEWQELVSAEFGFQVDMPTPIETRDSDEHSDLIHQQTEFNSKIGNTVASVVVAQLKPEILERYSPPFVFQIIAGSYDLDCGGTLQLKNVTVQKGVFRGFCRQCSRPAGTSIKSFLWLVDDRLFQVMVGGRESDVVSSDADRIFNSFKLLAQ